MLSVKAGWVRWAPVNAILNGVITYGNIEKPGGLVGVKDEPDEDIAKFAADNNASYHSLPYYKGTTVTLTIGDEDLDKLSTATRLRDTGEGLYGLDPNKTVSPVGMAYVVAMVQGEKIAKYRVKYYPMVSFKTPASSVKTSGEDIEMEPIEIEGDVITKDGILPYYWKDFNTEAEAIAFAEGSLGRQINVQFNLGEGHVENQENQHQLEHPNVQVGRQVAVNALIQGLGNIIPPEGMRLIGWALQPGGEVVELVNPGLGVAMQNAAQQFYAVYEQQQEQPNENEGG